MNGPTARYLHSGVWTGAEMVVWGGFATTYLSGGGRYTPCATDHRGAAWAQLLVGWDRSRSGR